LRRIFKLKIGNLCTVSSSIPVGFLCFFIAWAVISLVYAPPDFRGGDRLRRCRKICAIEGQVYVRN